MYHWSRRQFVRTATAFAVTWAGAGSIVSAQPAATRLTAKPWLMFTRSQAYEHAVIKRRADGSSVLGQSLAPVFADRAIEVVESKDGRLLEPDAIGRWGGFVFYSCGDLTKTDVDQSPPATNAGVAALVAAVEGGVPFIGIHSASDTFRPPVQGPTQPYNRMLGGAFEAHGKQQSSTLRIVAPDFPGAGTPDDWQMQEEWYALIHLAPDIRPVHLLETAGMDGKMYARAPFPLTWTRTHGKGRVFYTGLGHREDVVNSDKFRQLISGAIDWCRDERSTGR